MQGTSGDTRIHCLDGLRGLAALWVFVGHAQLLSGWRLPLLSHADLGVDLFILLSGFLMAFHYLQREAKEPWRLPAIWLRFWTRRFFRIAPLYYVALIAALILGSYIFESRLIIDTFNGDTPQLASRYTDASPANIVLHATFLFGFLPDYAFRTALPDWSIGLEMQFYAAFPLLMLMIRSIGWRIGAVLIGVIGVAISTIIAWMGIEYPMPAFLPLKLHLFLAGMLFAGALWEHRFHRVYFLAIAFVLTMFEGGILHTVARLLIVAGFFCLLHHDVIGGVVGSLFQRLANLLGTKPFHWLGELSYGTYLLHLLVMTPVAAWTITKFGKTISAPERFAIVLSVMPAVYILAFLTYSLIEMPGQNLGRRILGRQAKHRISTV